MGNRLYFGDCLDVLREDVADETVDLIYLDPPFNSKRLYNAFIGGAQWVAFDDTWRWHEAVDDFHEVASQPSDIASTMEGLRRILGEGPELAYLAYMANRLAECRRVLKPIGSIYLHCDPTMSHYLKVLMDALFGRPNFRNEIVWKRTSSHNDSRGFGRVSDHILFYGAPIDRDAVRAPLRTKYVRDFYRHEDERGRYGGDNLSAKGLTGGGYTYDFHGHPGPWRYPEHRIKELEQEGRIHLPAKAGGVPRLKRYLHENKGQVPPSIWTDIPPLQGASKEYLGYPTQKPLALLERIVKASSREGDVVMDPFCGCGTTIHAAQGLRRKWIGIDVCVNACKIIERRLRGHFEHLWDDVAFIGMPKTAEDAKTLARLDKFRFERWAASLVDGMEANRKQRGDKGIDGRDRIAIRKGKFVDIVSQVKGGGTGPGDVQAFNGARQQADADMGVFICFEERVTPAMRDAAASTGRFMDAPTVQIYTVEDYFDGRVPIMPKAT